MRKLISILLLLLLVIDLKIALLAAEPTPVLLIVSNSVDMPGAEKLNRFLIEKGFSTKIVGASEFDEELHSCMAAIILGGPDAYEGIGSISSSFLTLSEQMNLRKNEGARVFHLEESDGKEIIVLAGHTRVETSEAVDLFMEEWFKETNTWLLSSDNILYVLEGEFVQLTTYNYTIVLSSSSKISINLKKILDLQQYGRVQKVLESSIVSDPPYESLTDNGEWVSLEWAPSIGHVKVSRIVKVQEEVYYGPFTSSSPYPVDLSLFNESVSKYMESTPYIQVDDPQIKSLAESLTKGSKTQMEAALKIIGWVREHITYTCSKSMIACYGVPFADAKRTLENKVGNCVNFANLALALLRAAGIPCRDVTGFVADVEREERAAHVWIEVLYPDLGWIEYESSYWMPRSGLVPPTYLIPQHITFPRCEVGVSYGYFDEYHLSSLEIKSLPEECSKAHYELKRGQSLTFFVSIELPSLVDDEVELKVDKVPQGWDISFSTNPTKFYELESKSKDVGVTITPKEGEIPGVYTIIITAESKSHGYQGKIIVNVDVRP